MQSILSTKYLVDTNILIYALDKTSPFYPASRQILKECLEGTKNGVIAQQNLLECANFLFRETDRKRSEIMMILTTYAKDFNLSLITPLRTTIFTFFELCKNEKVRKKQMFDIFLAATMLDNEITTIITANEKDFADIKEISVYNPFT